MKICVIFNPVARGDKARHFRKHLAALSQRCSLKPTYAPGSGIALAAEAVREGFEIIVAAGGDGTVNEVLNGMAGEPEGLKAASLGVLPLGTVNVFAKELNLPGKLQAAWQIVEAGHTVAIDVGKAEFEVDGKPQLRYFAQMAGAGVDSRAIELVDWEHKKRVGKLAYVIAALKALREKKPIIAITDGKSSVSGEQVLIGNGQFYGGKYRLFPKATMRDGLLEATVLGRANWGTLTAGAIALMTGNVYRSRRISHLQAEALSITASVPMPFQLDGDNVGHLPARFSIQHLSVRVLAPANTRID